MIVNDGVCRKATIQLMLVEVLDVFGMLFHILQCIVERFKIWDDTPDKSQAEFFTDSYGVVHNQPVLLSLNTKYSPILISPEQRFEIVGKVLN